MMPVKDQISEADLKTALDYDEATGIFTWKAPTGRRTRIGDVAGAITEKGYRVIGVKGKVYFAHRLAWLYVHGKWPTEFLDHINGDRADNRIANLREADRALNGQNLKQATAQNQSSGFLGVSKVKTKKKWRAMIDYQGLKISLGYFETPELAHQAYLMVKRKLHDGCTI